MENKNAEGLRLLEGMGYCGAVMIMTSILLESPVLRFFYYSGIALELIVIVRLLANIAGSLNAYSGNNISSVDEDDYDNPEEITR